MARRSCDVPSSSTLFPNTAGVVMAERTDAAPDSDYETLKPDDAVRVLESLLPAQNESFVLGLELKLPPHEVEAIHSGYPGAKDRLLQIILSFLKQSKPRPTWIAIIKALRSPTVNLTALADRLVAAHCSVSAETTGMSLSPTGVQLKISYLYSPLDTESATNSTDSSSQLSPVHGD